MRTHLELAIVMTIAGCGVPARLGAIAKAPAALAKHPAAASTVSPTSTTRSGPTAPSGSGPVHQTVVVPDVVGRTPDQARAIVRAAGFTTEIEPYAGLRCEGAPRDPGRINCQDPAAGKVVSTYAMIRFTVFEPMAHPEQLMRDQVEALHGMTPDEAKQRLRQLGHDGVVSVGVVVQFNPKCGQNKVCDTNRDGGMGIHDDIELHLNRKLDIPVPP